MTTEPTDKSEPKGERKPEGEGTPGGEGMPEGEGKPFRAAAERRTLDDNTLQLLRRCWRDWIAHRWRALVVALLLMAVVAATTGLYPLVIKYSYDTLADGDMTFLATVLIVIVVITALKSLFLYLQTVATQRIVLRMVVDIQRDIFSHLIGSDFARLAREAPGHMISRLTNDMNYIQLAALSVLNSAVRDILTIIALIAAMFYLDWFMSLIVLGLYPLAGFPIARIGQRLRRVAKRTQGELGAMTAELAETLGGARLIKTYRLEDYARARINRRFEDIFRLRMKTVRAKARLDPMLEALGGLAVAGVIALAGYRIAAGVNTVGDFTGFVSALLMAAQPLRGLGNLNARVQEGLAAAERVFALLDEAPRIVDAPGARTLEVRAGELRFEDVHFTYPGSESHAVRAFSLEVPAGTVVALVGRSGAGKSTVINLVPRLFEISSGRILIDGQDVRAVTLASLRQAVAMVSQDITLFNDTIAANIALGRLGATREEIMAAAKAATAHDFVAALPEGYDTVIGERGMRLSGGQRQRIALARAILKDAPILLLDEATSALDAESERAVQEALGRFAEGRTTLVIAHRLSTVQNADLICVMEEGRIIEQGSHRALLARGGVYERLCRSQLIATDGAPAAGADGTARTADGADAPGASVAPPRAPSNESSANSPLGSAPTSTTATSTAPKKAKLS